MSERFQEECESLARDAEECAHAVERVGLPLAIASRYRKQAGRIRDFGSMEPGPQQDALEEAISVEYADLTAAVEEWGP